MTTPVRRRLAAMTLAASLAVSFLTPLAASDADAAPSGPGAAVTDRIATPALTWTPCDEGVDCATVTVPLDHDEPRGATIDLALTRHRATRPSHRVGSLFVNPGGPGGSSAEFAAGASRWASPTLLQRFDIIGMDPRGTNGSTGVHCFASAAAEAEALAGFDVTYPETSAEVAAHVAASRRVGRACSTHGAPLSASMSTANVARDMDLVRRAVGESKLTYLGFSYGTYLGTVYANLYPGRVRALAIDGVLDPVAWAGTGATRHTPISLRTRAPEAAQRALDASFARCAAAGPQRCAIAPDPWRAFRTVAARLKAEPLVDVASGTVIDESVFVSSTYGLLMVPGDVEHVAELVAILDGATAPRPSLTAASRSRLLWLRARAAAAQEQYANGLDANLAVVCTDALHPTNANQVQRAIAVAERTQSPWFAEPFGWNASSCVQQFWSATDEDAYRGGFSARTSAPVLVVGNLFDPTTNYSGAVATARLLPNSRLLTSRSWGHTAYGTSDCVTGAIDRYLVRGVLPERGTVCVGDVQPYAGP